MVGMRRVTIRDVAEAAGVSVSTISKVVNDRDGIAPDTQRRVREVVDRLGYIGSVGARSLRATHTGVFGVLVSQFEPYSAEVLKGVARVAEGCDYEMMAWAGASHGPYAPPGWEQRLLGRLAGSLIDGAILVTPSVPDAGGFPVVAVDPHELEPGQPAVFSDDESGVASAVRYLAGLGHVRIGYLGGRDDLVSAQARARGFRAAMAQVGLPVQDEWLAEGDYTASGAEPGATRLLAAEPRPTAVVAANDVSALRLIELARERGLRVPDDLSVTGFDDVPEAANAVPPLTTVAQPLHDLGATAMRLLLDVLAGRPVADEHVCLPTRLVIRGSTAPPPA